jgi:hypothetical protein
MLRQKSAGNILKQSDAIKTGEYRLNDDCSGRMDSFNKTGFIT